jgi:hypothetical protein
LARGGSYCARAGAGQGLREARATPDPAARPKAFPEGREERGGSLGPCARATTALGLRPLGQPCPTRPRPSRPAPSRVPSDGRAAQMSCARLNRYPCAQLPGRYFTGPTLSPLPGSLAPVPAAPDACHHRAGRAPRRSPDASTPRPWAWTPETPATSAPPRPARAGPSYGIVQGPPQAAGRRRYRPFCGLRSAPGPSATSPVSTGGRRPAPRRRRSSGPPVSLFLLLEDLPRPGLAA